VLWVTEVCAASGIDTSLLKPLEQHVRVGHGMTFERN